MFTTVNYQNFKLHYEDYGEVEGHIDASSVGGKLAKEVHFYLDGQWCSGVNRGHGENGFKADSLTGESERKLFIFQELVTTGECIVLLIPTCSSELMDGRRR